jgi:hypothetical protein
MSAAAKQTRLQFPLNPLLILSHDCWPQSNTQPMCLNLLCGVAYVPGPDGLASTRLFCAPRSTTPGKTPDCSPTSCRLLLLGAGVCWGHVQLPVANQAFPCTASGRHTGKLSVAELGWPQQRLENSSSTSHFNMALEHHWEDKGLIKHIWFVWGGG